MNLIFKATIKDKFEKNKKNCLRKVSFCIWYFEFRFNVNKNFSIGDQRKKWLIKDRLINVYNQKKRLKKCVMIKLKIMHLSLH